MRDVPGVLQPMCFGHVRGVINGAVFPYLNSSVKWDRHLERAVGRTAMMRLWRQLLEVRS